MTEIDEDVEPSTPSNHGTANSLQRIEPSTPGSGGRVDTSNFAPIEKTIKLGAQASAVTTRNSVTKTVSFGQASGTNVENMAR